MSKWIKIPLIISSSFFFGAVLGSWLTLQSQNQLEMKSITPSTASSFESIWAEDIKNLVSKKRMPKEWDSIKEVRYRPLSKISSQWLSKVQIPIPLNINGSHILNVEVDHWLQEQKIAAIVHYQIVDIKSGNTVKEFGRTYPLK